MPPSPKIWMWVSIGLALIVGASFGLLADRVFLRQPVALAAPPPERGPVFFICRSGSLDVENEPGYLYPEGFRQGLLRGLSRDLDLRPEQSAELGQMLEDKRKGARSFWEDLRHAYCDLRDAFRSDIRALLDPDQQQRFDALMKDIDRRQLEWVEERSARKTPAE